jgi:hypothetical protein
LLTLRLLTALLGDQAETNRFLGVGWDGFDLPNSSRPKIFCKSSKALTESGDRFIYGILSPSVRRYDTI